MKSMIVSCIMLCSCFPLFAQQTDTATNEKNERNYKNAVKLNLTSNLLYRNAICASFERLVNDRQSFSIYGGYHEFPGGIRLNLENATLEGNLKRNGYSIGADYRFYLASENKYKAHHGVYIGPFMSYFDFNSERTLTYTGSTPSQSSQLITSVSFFNVGGQVGYQFVVWKRIVIDAIFFGPSISNYKFKARLDGEIDGLDEDEALAEIIDALIEKFPLLGDLEEGREVDRKGVKTFWSGGFRYGLNIGFRF